MPRHLSTDVDDELWKSPLIGGVSARLARAIGYLSLSIALFAAIVAAILNFAAPRLNDLSQGAPLGFVLLVAFFGGGVIAGIAFPLMFRQARREGIAGYTTLREGSLAGYVPVVNPRTRKVERSCNFTFDLAVSRSLAPWSTSDGPPSHPEPPLPPTVTSAMRSARWLFVLSTVFIVMAQVVRVWSGETTIARTTTIAIIVTVIIFSAVFGFALVLRVLQVDRLAKVSAVASGIIVAAISSYSTLGLRKKLNLKRGAIPLVAVLVFDASGFSIWRGSKSPHQVLHIDRSDVVEIDTTIILSGRAMIPGIQVEVIAPDELSTLDLTFSVFDPSRLFIALKGEKLTSLVSSVTNQWIDAANVGK